MVNISLVSHILFFLGIKYYFALANNYALPKLSSKQKRIMYCYVKAFRQLTLFAIEILSISIALRQNRVVLWY